MEPYFDDQKMNVSGSPIKYWEGIIRVRAGDLKGEQIGMGYLEMMGYEPMNLIYSFYTINLFARSPDTSNQIHTL